MKGSEDFQSEVKHLKNEFLSFVFYVFQDALDLISGHYTVNRSNPSPFQLNGFESFSVCINALWYYPCYKKHY